ncbi:MAG: hypothetical protein E7054_07525 [Lentisphaerae bacterium]|nr:hypothetical protein [Lentisphaerota bacterium]
MKKFISVLLICSLWAVDIFAAERPIERKRYGGKLIRVRQSKPGGSIRGQLADKEQVAQAAEKFFAIMDKLPKKFVKESKLKFVTFFSTLQLNNAPAAGVAGGDRISLIANFSEKTLYHEMFHIFDQGKRTGGWSKLNHKEFIYTGSAFYERKLIGRKARQRTKNLEEGRFDDDFVSRYAMSDPKEDRAETFAAMMAEGPDFLKRSRKSAVMKKKMHYIIEMTGTGRLLGTHFWEDHLCLTSEDIDD